MTELHDGLAWLGREIVRGVIPLVLGTLVLLVGAVIADRLLERRVSAAWRVALFAAVPLRVLLPWSWASPVGIVPPQLAAAVSVSEEIAFVPTPSSAPPRPAPVALEATFDPSVAVGCAYLVGVLLLLGHWTRARLHLESALRNTREVSLPGAAPVRGHPTLGPFVAGTLRPRVILPLPLIDVLDDESMRFVLAHEEAHVARRDPLLVSALQLVCMVAWPLVPVWFALRRARHLIECACDERALRDSGPATRTRYGALLVRLAERPATPAAALAANGADLMGRLRALRFRRRWAGWSGAALVVAAVGLAGAASAMAQSRAPVAASASARGPAVWTAIGAGERTATLFDQVARQEVHIIWGDVDPSAMLAVMLGLGPEAKPVVRERLAKMEQSLREGMISYSTVTGGPLHTIAAFAGDRGGNVDPAGPVSFQCMADQYGRPPARQQRTGQQPSAALMYNTMRGTHLLVAVTVGVDGRATDLKLLGSNTGRNGFDRCVVDRLRALTFSPPVGGPAQVQYRLRIGGEAGSDSTLIADFGLTKGEIMDLVRAREPEFQVCHRRALEQDPYRLLRVRLRVTISGDGVVRSVVRADLRAPPMAVEKWGRQVEKEGDEVECLKDVLRKISFPKPTTAQPVTFVYPISSGPAK